MAEALGKVKCRMAVRRGNFSRISRLAAMAQTASGALADVYSKKCLCGAGRRPADRSGRLSIEGACVMRPATVSAL